MNPKKQFCMKFIHCGNISLANPEDKEQKNIFFMPMGLFPMADIMEKNGVDVEIIHSDLEAGKSIEEIINFQEVDMVGFDDHWVNESVVVMDTAALIKRINPEIFVVIGGFSASLFAEEIVADFPQIDAVVRGDGEVPIVELAGMLHREKLDGKSIVRERDPEKFKQVQNLVWRTPDNRVAANPISYTATPEDLEKLDFAAIHKLRHWEGYRLSSFFYTNFEPIKHSPMFLLEAARGCEYACTFCGGNCVAQKKMNNRTKTVFRSVESSLETVKKAVSFGFETFYTSIESEDSDDWYITFFNRVKEEQLKIHYTYGCWRIPPPPLVDAMSEACREVIIEISPETSSYELRRKNKDPRIAYTNEEMEKCLDYISTKDNVKVQLFFGFYVSGDNAQSVMDTLRYTLYLLIKYPDLLEIEYTNFSTDPGSLFFFNPEKYDIDIKVRNFKDYIAYLTKNYVEKKGQQADMTVFRPSALTEAGDAELRRKMRLYNYMFYTYRKTVSYILKKTQSPDLIMSIAKTSDIQLTEDNVFPLDELKHLFLTACTKYDILDDTLVKLIPFECDKMKKAHLVSKPTTQLYMDFDLGEQAEDGKVYDSMMAYVKKGAQEPDDSDMDIDFDI